jgi:hypothetical protein
VDASSLVADIPSSQLQIGPRHVTVTPYSNSPGVSNRHLEAASCCNRIPWAKYCTLKAQMFIVSWLTSLQEFKIFEIASTVTDAMTNSIRAWTIPQNARDILNQLHRILTSCRGGNATLSTMLRIKIAQIQDKQPLLLERGSHTSVTLEADRLNTPEGFSFEGDNQYGSILAPAHAGEDDEEAVEEEETRT